MPRIHNVHRRVLPVAPDILAPLLDGLAGPHDRLWPRQRWPAMRLDAGLEVGATGGHGPVRYRVAEYSPGRHVRFEFDPGCGLARGFQGGHSFRIEAVEGGSDVVHVLEADCPLGAWVRWVVVIRPLHGALVEDALDRAERETTDRPVADRHLSWWVRALRACASPRSAERREP